MKPSSKWTLLGISHIAAFAVGGTLFYYLSTVDQLLANMQESQEIVALTHSNALLMELENRGTKVAYQDELLRRANLLEEFRGKNGKIINDRIIDTEKMLVFIRLAATKAKESKTREESEFMAKAIELCPKSGFKECSAAELRMLGERIDKSLQQDFSSR